VQKEADSATGLAPPGPDEPLFTGDPQPGHQALPEPSRQAGAASARSLVFPSSIYTYQVGWICLAFEHRIGQCPPPEAARVGIRNTYTELIQASDNLRMGRGEGGGFIHFHDNSHREKKRSPASPQGLELNSQGCQSDQEFNSIYSVGRLSGASASASGCCPESAQAEQPES